MSDDSHLEFLRPSLRLFLSADIVGSTAYKQNLPILYSEKVTDHPTGPVWAFESLAPPWLSPTAKFYRGIDRLFIKNWKRYAEVTAPKIKWNTGSPPELWKGVGDEIIYTKELASHREAFACVSTWRSTIIEYRKNFVRDFKNLDIKATAWLAGFPIRNAEVILKSDISELDLFDTGDDVFYNFFLLEKFYENKSAKEFKSNYTRDFIGPSVDTGFRLGSLSDPRKMVISVDLALLLVSVTRPVDAFDRIYVRYDGRKELKGVLGGKPYPIFWIDMLHSDPLLQAEDSLGGPTIQSEENIREFCEIFLEEHEEFMIRPFIMGSDDPHFNEAPEHYRNRLAQMSRNWPDAKAHKETEIAAMKGQEAPGETVDPIATSDDIEHFSIPRAPRESSTEPEANPGASPTERPLQDMTES